MVVKTVRFDMVERAAGNEAMRRLRKRSEEAFDVSDTPIVQDERAGAASSQQCAYMAV
jgi:hypothetical protein